MSGNSWVTLATNDSYSLGALVLAHSLKRVGTKHNLTVMITPGVTESMRNQLASVFNVVEEVNILDSKDEKNLALLTRPELGITFTKLHCWRLTQFSKCVFLDADVLVLQNCDELFDREELSAAPDVGWPDCFNSGVFVYCPSIETYNALINFALSQGSFDGGDQGLLNQFFSDWSTKDISRHLPFIYNMCSSATYSYLPAFKQFGQNVKIVHFIGSAKPWLQILDSETRQVRPSLGSEHLLGLLQLWWDIFCRDVHSNLSSEMAGLAGALSQLTLGVARSPEQIALEEHLRKQAWEHGNIDYMGRDSFDNIWRKICQTLAEAPSAESPPEQSESSSQVSSLVVQTVSQGDAPASDTPPLPPPLPEPHSLASAHKESNNEGTNVESLLTKLDTTEEPSISTGLVLETNAVFPSSTATLSETTSLPTFVANTLTQIPAFSPVVESSETVDISVDSIPKETVAFNSAGTDSQSPQENVSDVVPQNIVSLQQEESPVSEIGSELDLSVGSGLETGSEGITLPVQIPLQDVAPAGDVSFHKTVQTSIVTTLESVAQDNIVSASSEILKQSGAESEESSEQLSKVSSPLSEEASVPSDVSRLDLLISSNVMESQVSGEVQSVDTLENVQTPLTESSTGTDTQSSDSKLAADLVSETLNSSALSNTISESDPAADPQSVTVIEPTPPTSPVDSSEKVPSVPESADTLTVEPSIPATPPVGSDAHSANVTESSTSVQSATQTPTQSPASIASSVSEAQVSVDSSPQSVDPKAPIPPKRKHKPSQNPDQSGSKTGKASSKSSKGKK